MFKAKIALFSDLKNELDIVLYCIIFNTKNNAVLAKIFSSSIVILFTEAGKMRKSRNMTMDHVNCKYNCRICITLLNRCISISILKRTHLKLLVARVINLVLIRYKRECFRICLAQWCLKKLYKNYAFLLLFKFCWIFNKIDSPLLKPARCLEMSIGLEPNCQ